MDLPQLAGSSADVRLLPPSTSARRTDVAVVGGGVIGLSTALELATRDQRVTVIDPHPAGGASWVAGGMLGATLETGFAEVDDVELHLAARQAWEPFLELLNAGRAAPVSMSQGGTFLLGADASDARELDRLTGFMASVGLEVARCDPSELDEQVPGLSPGIRAGFHVPGDPSVDNRQVMVALLERCQEASVQFIAATATSMRRSGDWLEGIELDDGTTLRTGAAVLATGAVDTAGLGPHDAPAIRPVKGTIVRLGPRRGPILDVVLRGLVRGRMCYLVPRPDGCLAIGATTEERGYDTSVDALSVFSLLEDARALLPGIDDLEFLEASSGLRPATTDHRPVVCASTVRGLVFNLGHYRNGFLMAPLAAQSVAELLEGRRAHPGFEGKER